MRTISQSDAVRESLENLAKGLNLGGNRCILLTFDDGGRSLHTTVAPILEEFGWRGHFFISTDYIDSKSFLTKEQIIDLHRRGHVIGSHSKSHPNWIAKCSYKELVEEWRESIVCLSDILGVGVDTASVPGGFFSNRVAAAADKCGIRYLFTSEPVTSWYLVGNCIIFGRYKIMRSTSCKQVEKLIASNDIDRMKQYLVWNSKKIFKKISSPIYTAVRKTLLARIKI